MHDVAVGEDKSVRRNDDAGAHAALGPADRVGLGLDPHDRRADGVDDIDNRLGIGVEQRLAFRKILTGNDRSVCLAVDQAGTVVKHVGGHGD